MITQGRSKEMREKRQERLKKYLPYRVAKACVDYKKEHGLSNEGLAEVLDVHKGTAAKYCRMTNDMRLDSFLNIVESLDLDLSELLKGTKWDGIRI